MLDIKLKARGIPLTFSRYKRCSKCVENPHRTHRFTRELKSSFQLSYPFQPTCVTHNALFILCCTRYPQHDFCVCCPLSRWWWRWWRRRITPAARRMSPATCANLSRTCTCSGWPDRARMRTGCAASWKRAAWASIACRWTRRIERSARRASSLAHSKWCGWTVRKRPPSRPPNASGRWRNLPRCCLRSDPGPPGTAAGRRGARRVQRAQGQQPEDRPGDP